MMNIIGKLARITLLDKLDLYSSYRLKRSGYLKNIGWFRSYKGKISVDSNGEPIPWITYCAISFLVKRINQNMAVFEYSTGNSTLWWAKRVRELISCEHELEWYEKMKELIPSNVKLIHLRLKYGGEYSKKISEYNQAFDIIVIDGRDRVNCAKNCLNALKQDGVIIWDDSDRDSYEEGFKFLYESGFKRIDFEGMGPIIMDSWCTSIFYKKDNCLQI